MQSSTESEKSSPEEDYSQVKFEQNGILDSSEHCDNGNKPSNSKSNTIIVRNSDISQAVYIRRCTTCMKRTYPEYYFSWEFMEFCNILCISKFQGLNFKCVYCSHFINNTLFGKFYIRYKNNFRFFCSIACMDNYKLTVKCCSYCQRDSSDHFSVPAVSYGIQANNIYFCSIICCDLFNVIVKYSPPARIPTNAICCVCQQDKPITVVLKHDGEPKYFCAERCLVAYSFVKLQAGTGQCVLCQNYFSQIILDKYTVYYENVSLSFCSTICQNIYILLKGETVSCTWCQNKRYNFGMIRKFSNVSSQNIYICSVNCFKLYECSISKGSTFIQQSQEAVSYFAEKPLNVILDTTGIAVNGSQGVLSLPNNLMCMDQNEVSNNLQYSSLTSNQFVINSKTPVEQRNVATMCFIPKSNKNVMVQPIALNKTTQTDKIELTRVIFPTPVPIYVPTPVAMYSVPIPMAVPFVIPIPVPVFIPIAKQSVAGIMNEIEMIHNSIPNDPCEAEILKIADIIADDQVCEKHSDILQEESKLGIDLQLKTGMKSNTELILNEHLTDSQKTKTIITDLRSKRLLDDSDECVIQSSNKKVYNILKPTNNDKVSLKYTLGIDAFHQWLKSQIRASKKSAVDSNSDKVLFRTNILEMVPDEINLALETFIDMLKKPDGSEYAPDTIYYLCLGIQYYLIENGRNDNIFMDKPFDKFCETLHKCAEKFSSLYHEQSYFIITRVEEEYLWETKQLGCYSPQTVLNTLVYFNTKYYHCSTVEQHLHISFFKILKLWRKKSKSKTMILRYHQKNINGIKYVYEQYENDVDQTRCPIRIFEFYLSKCPESVKTSDSLFYLQPEQYCTTDSPLWYMNNSLSKDTLVKMLNRIKMAKEINISLLTNT